ncbi:GHMP kinase [Flagellimonas sp. HMM57]|uniref:GHMP family kinase ATP-binding protein n=1 Tax=unclassified Flagellimonas TaxID=2644544 RepID=UPI0013D68E86|nr:MULTISPECIES: GHMP kinase [unclassified Flagellimonas]UII76656.1 GHMP kinase [Flagellimonas sp. HMM57]
MVHVKVPARICFFGDHQDYLGLPVIAGTINRFIHLSAAPNSQRMFHIKLLDLKSTISISLDDDLIAIKKNDYYRSSMAILKKEGFDFISGYDIEISGNIPINAGLSSSSAIVVAWIRFLSKTQEYIGEIDDIQVGKWAYKAEVQFFGQPGGLMDMFTIAQGGLLHIDTKIGKTERLVGGLGKLIVAESGISKKTLSVLKNARSYAEKAVAAVKNVNPKFSMEKATLDDYQNCKTVVPNKYREHWFAAIHNYDITLQAKRILQNTKPDLKLLGELMNNHQAILQNQIRNTPLDMIEMMDAARKSGAFGAKIIGSGGGGCMVAIVDDTSKNVVKQAFLDAGAVAAYEVKLITI